MSRGTRTQPTDNLLRRALVLIPATMCLSAGFCSGFINDDSGLPLGGRPYFYIDREDDTCQYRQYFRKQGNENVRVITYKRKKNPKGREWFTPGSTELADRITAMDGFANAKSSRSTGPPDTLSLLGGWFRERFQTTLPDPEFFLLDDQSRIHVVSPERATPLTATIRLPEDARGMARARPNGPLFVVHRGVPPDHPFLPETPPKISVVDVANQRVSRVMDLVGKALVNFRAAPLAVSPDEREVYVANAGDALIDGVLRINSTIEVYRSATGDLLAEIPMPPDPLARGTQTGNTLEANNVYVTPDGKTLWVARENGFDLVVIDVRTRTVSAHFRTTAGFTGFADLAFSPDGTRAYVLGRNIVRVFDVATLETIASIPLEEAQRARRLSLSPDGFSLFARDDLAGLVWSIDTVALQVFETTEEFPGSTSVLAFAL